MNGKKSNYQPWFALSETLEEVSAHAGEPSCLLSVLLQADSGQLQLQRFLQTLTLGSTPWERIY